MAGNLFINIAVSVTLVFCSLDPVIHRQEEGEQNRVIGSSENQMLLTTKDTKVHKAAGPQPKRDTETQEVRRE